MKAKSKFEEYSLNGVKAKILIDKRRVKDDLTYPVKYYLSHKRRTYYIRTGINISINDWDGLFKSESTDALEIKMFLKIGFNNIKKYIKELVNENEFDINELKRRLDKDGLFKFNPVYIPSQIDILKSLSLCSNEQLMNELKKRLIA